MAKLTIRDLEYVVREVLLPFYTIERDIPLPMPPRRNKYDAEHSWSLAVFACTLAPHVDPGLDIGLVSQFALVHDLPEIYAGDTSVWASKSELGTKEEREAKAVKTIGKRLKRFPWLVETVERYERQDCAEAHFVRSLDKCLALLFDYMDECLYHRERNIDMQGFIAGMQAHRKKAQIHKGAFAYYDKIWQAILARPAFFEQPVRTA